MTKTDCFSELKKLLDFHFPDKSRYGAEPYWRQDPYYSDLVKLSIKYRRIAASDDVYSWVYATWAPARKHPIPTYSATQLAKLVDAWDD